jgi:hypothetical protein
MDVCPGDSFLPMWLQIEAQKKKKKKNAALESRPGSQDAVISLGTTAADEMEPVTWSSEKRNY